MWHASAREIACVSVRDLPARPGVIYSCFFPKSGTHSWWVSLQAEEAWESGDSEVRLWGVFNETKAQVEGLQHRQTALVEAAERAARAHIKVRERGGGALLCV